MSQWTMADVMRQRAKVGQPVTSDTDDALGAALQGARMAPKASKYKNVKTVINGEKFDSKREADHWLLLLARVQAGEITDLKRQVRFPLYCPQMYTLSVRSGALSQTTATIVPPFLQVAEYIADFTYLENGQLVVVDAKGRRIAPYPLKKKWLFLQSGIEIVEV